MKTKTILKKTAQFASKCVTYPLLGNLTSTLDHKIEKSIGKDWFNYENAQVTSFITNIGLYPLAAYGISRALGVDPVNFGGIIAMSGLYAMIEDGVRFVVTIGESKAGADSEFCGCGSLPGKLVSMPIEKYFSKKK